MENAEFLMIELENMMQMHDWYYHFSDDHSVWKRGQAQASEILVKATYLRVNGKEEEVKALYDKYSVKF